LNSANVVVGTAEDAANGEHPFIWRNGSMSALLLNVPANSGWAVITPRRITDDARIFATAKLLGECHALQLSPQVDGSYNLTDLGVPNGTAPSLVAFNQFGWASGYGEFYPPLRVEAFLFRGGTTTLLGNLGSSGSYGNGLNDLGDVVGMSNSRSYRAFLWREGIIYDLNSCIPTNSGWVLVEANGINNASQIVGHGMLNGSHRAFLLDPVPGSAQGLTLTLQPTTAPNRWRLRLARQPTTNVCFAVSADLVHWTPVDCVPDGDSFLVEAESAAGPRFFRAACGP
jgi:probable HAF family extracellular repeat protein